MVFFADIFENARDGLVVVFTVIVLLFVLTKAGEIVSFFRVRSRSLRQKPKNPKD